MTEPDEPGRSGPIGDYERHAQDWHEWSTDVSDYDHKGERIGPPKRLFVRNQDGCCELIESEVTSANPAARELENGRVFSLYLGRILAEWLHAALGKALAVDNEVVASEDKHTARLFVFEELEEGGGYHTFAISSEKLARGWSDPYKKSGAASYRNRVVQYVPKDDSAEQAKPFIPLNAAANNPTTLGAVWVGESRPPAELLAECFAQQKRLGGPRG